MVCCGLMALSTQSTLYRAFRYRDVKGLNIEVRGGVAKNRGGGSAVLCPLNVTTAVLVQTRLNDSSF